MTDFKRKPKTRPSGLVCGWGINDVDFCTSYRENGKLIHHPAYRAWFNMINRVHKEANYSDCTVSEEWRKFSSFLSWWEENYREGYQLDKDILVKGNREYGPHTCLYVPSWMNMQEVRTRPNKKRGCSLPGVTYDHNLKRYKAQRDNGDNRYLGYFDTAEEAHAAWVADGGWGRREQVRKEYDICRQKQIQLLKSKSI